MKLDPSGIPSTRGVFSSTRSLKPADLVVSVASQESGIEPAVTRFDHLPYSDSSSSLGHLEAEQEVTIAAESSSSPVGVPVSQVSKVGAGRETEDWHPVLAVDVDNVSELGACKRAGV